MNNKSVGKYISLVREHQMIKQEMLAFDVNISRPMLSKIENGVEECSDELLTSIFDILEIDLKEYRENKNWIYKEIETIYKFMIYGNDSYLSLLANLEQKCNENIHLTFYPEYNLIRMSDAYKKGRNKEYLNLLEECSKDEVYYDDYELVIYKEFLSFKYAHENNNSKSLEILNSINVSGLPDYIKGMIEYHKGNLYHVEKDYYPSIKHYEQALTYFANAQAFNKIVYTQVNLSDVFFKIGNYTLSMETIEKSLSAAYTIGDITIIRIIHSNIAWFSLMMGDYENTIKHVQEAMLYDNTKADCYFYLVFSYFRLGDANKALHYVDLAEEVCDEENLDFRMSLAVKKMIKQSPNLEEYLEKLYESINPITNPGNKQFSIEFLMSYYKEINNYEKLAYYSIELNKLLAKKLLMIEQ